VYLRRERNVIKRIIDVRAEEKFFKMKKRLKNEALKRSRSVLTGKIAEKFVPFFVDFKYDPSDANFLGSPIDYIIFHGYSAVKDRKIKTPITVIFAEIKTGESGELTFEQKKIKEAIDNKRVKWETIHLKV
jgi:predicted Holliday junction resolvase-like endonuclease